MGGRAAWPARRPAAHLSPDPEGQTQAGRGPCRVAGVCPRPWPDSGSTRVNDTTLTSLKIVVERAVRPVRAGARRKDRMREELLAHLTGIYDQEHARLGDERAALDKAIRRFGEPADLTRGLQESLTREDRLTFFVERWIGWRAKESGARHTFCLAVLLRGFLGRLAL